MNRFGGADLLIHSRAHGGLDARHGLYFDLTHRGELPHRACPLGGDVVAVGLSTSLTTDSCPAARDTARASRVSTRIIDSQAQR